MSSANPGLALSVFDLSPYHYVPTRYVAIVFVILFALSTSMHLFQVVKHRMWWLLPTVCLCGLLEILGWSARLWSSFSPLLMTPFQIQIICTIIAPTPFFAANFIIFGKLVQRLGPAYSRLNPRWYGRIFCTCEFISLVVQAVGGGIAAMAVDSNGQNLGAHILLSGIVLQFVVIVAYAFCGIEYYIRYSINSPITSCSGKETDSDTTVRGTCTERLKHMAYALVFMTICLFIRAIYRTIELSSGWNGPIMSNQRYFNAFDGAMLIMAVYTLNLAHPGRLLAVPLDSTKFSGVYLMNA